MTDKQRDTDEMGPEGAADADTEGHVRRYAPSPATPDTDTDTEPADADTEAHGAKWISPAAPLPHEAGQEPVADDTDGAGPDQGIRVRI